MRYGSFSKSWGIFKTSWGVLKRDRELLWLAAASLGATVLVLLLAGLVLLVAGVLASDGTADSSWWEMPPVALLVLLGLVVSAGLSVSNAFFHGAIVHGTMERIAGGDPTVRSALSGARRRLGKIVMWGLVAITISWAITLIQAVLEKIRFVGWILSSLIDMAWEVMKFLVMPIIIAENLGPFDSLRRSKEMLKETWGANLVGQAGMGVVAMLLSLPAILVIVLAGAAGLLAVTVLGIAVAVVYLAAVGVLLSALNSVYQTVLYSYAMTGETPDGFTDSDVQTAFGPRKERSGFGI